MTNFIEVSNDYREPYFVEPDYDENGEEYEYSGGWIAGVGDITSRIEGDLAARVLARLGRDEGVVTIVEHHWDIGYCVTCSSEYIDFLIQVDGETEWETPTYQSQIEGAEQITSFAEFNAWLNGEEN